METNAKLTKFRRMASSALLRILESEKNEENLKCILTVLEQRNVEIPQKKLPEISVTEIESIVDKICENGSEILKKQIGEILEGVENYSDLDSEQKNQIKNLFINSHREEKPKSFPKNKKEEIPTNISVKKGETVIKFNYKGKEMEEKCIKKFTCKGTTYYKVIIDGVSRDINSKNLI